MRDDGTARARGDLHDLLQLLEGEGGLHLSTGTPAVVGVDLDPVGTASDLVSHDAHERGVVRFLGALQHLDLGSQTRRVAPRGDDGARDDDHARPRDDPLRDGAFEPHVGVARALGAEIALGGEAGAERLARVVGGARDSQRQGLVQHLIVPRRLVVRMEKQVRVPLDQSRQQSGAGERETPSTRGRGDTRRGTGGDDTLAAYEDDPSVVHLQAVEDPVGSEEHRGGVGDGGALRAHRLRRGHDESDGGRDGQRSEWRHESRKNRPAGWTCVRRSGRFEAGAGDRQGETYHEENDDGEDF